MKRDLKINEDEWSFLIDFLKRGNRLLLDRRSGLIKIILKLFSKNNYDHTRNKQNFYFRYVSCTLRIFLFIPLEGIIFPLLDKNDEELTDKI